MDDIEKFLYGPLLSWASSALVAIGQDYLFLAVLLLTALGLQFGEHGRKLKRPLLTFAGAVLSGSAVGFSCLALWMWSSLGPIYSVGFRVFAAIAIFSSAMIVAWHFGIYRRLGR